MTSIRLSHSPHRRPTPAIAERKSKPKATETVEFEIIEEVVEEVVEKVVEEEQE